MTWRRVVDELRSWPGPAWWLCPLLAGMASHYLRDSPLVVAAASRVVPLLGVALLGQIPLLEQLWGVQDIVRLADKRPGVTLLFRWAVGVTWLALTAWPVVCADAMGLFAQGALAGTVALVLNVWVRSGVGFTIPLLWWFVSQVVLWQRPDLIPSEGWKAWLVMGGSLVPVVRGGESAAAESGHAFAMLALSGTLAFAAALGRKKENGS